MFVGLGRKLPPPPPPLFVRVEDEDIARAEADVPVEHRFIPAVLPFPPFRLDCMLLEPPASPPPLEPTEDAEDSDDSDDNEADNCEVALF